MFEPLLLYLVSFHFGTFSFWSSLLIKLTTIIPMEISFYFIFSSNQSISVGLPWYKVHKLDFISSWDVIKNSFDYYISGPVLIIKLQ